MVLSQRGTVPSLQGMACALKRGREQKICGRKPHFEGPSAHFEGGAVHLEGASIHFEGAAVHFEGASAGFLRPAVCLEGSRRAPLLGAQHHGRIQVTGFPRRDRAREEGRAERPGPRWLRASPRWCRRPARCRPGTKQRWSGAEAGPEPPHENRMRCRPWSENGSINSDSPRPAALTASRSRQSPATGHTCGRNRTSEILDGSGLTTRGVRAGRGGAVAARRFGLAKRAGTSGQAKAVIVQHPQALFTQAQPLLRNLFHKHLLCNGNPPQALVQRGARSGFSRIACFSSGLGHDRRIRVTILLPSLELDREEL